MSISQLLMQAKNAPLLPLTSAVRNTQTTQSGDCSHTQEQSSSASTASPCRCTAAIRSPLQSHHKHARLWMDRPSTLFQKGPYEKPGNTPGHHKQHLGPCGTPHLSSMKGSKKSQDLTLTSHPPHPHVTSVRLCTRTQQNSQIEIVTRGANTHLT